MVPSRARHAPMNANEKCQKSLLDSAKNACGTSCRKTDTLFFNRINMFLFSYILVGGERACNNTSRKAQKGASHRRISSAKSPCVDCVGVLTLGHCGAACKMYINNVSFLTKAATSSRRVNKALHKVVPRWCLCKYAKLRE